MLTASNFGIVCRMRPTTSCATTVKNLLFPPIIDTAALKYGRDMEEIAKQDLIVKLKKEVKSCGLFIDCDNPWLGATPDGLLDEDGLVEIKCPLSAENLTAEEATETVPRLKNIFDKKNGNMMNKNHHYFYQIQGQLNITQREYCIFAVWTPKSVKTIRVQRDEYFWKNRMLSFLTRFYMECMLPEIVDSRYNRNMPIREPQYIMEAKEKSKIVVNQKRQQNMITCINEQLSKNNKKSKYDEIPTDTTDNVVVATVDSEEEDCIIVSDPIKYYLTSNDIINRKKVLDDTIIEICDVKDNILGKYSKLNDQSLDLFLRVVKETSRFETQSVQYIEYSDLITASRNQSVQIIGGNCTDHWRCIYFDGTKLYVYDSIPSCTYDKMASKEKEYIRARFPQIIHTDISFEKVQTQPDGTCCGIYAAAFATDVVLGKNPCKEKYSNDVESIRRHFFAIVQSRKLLPFPRQ
ncbi:hypothetical protein ALC62_02801 [Cyphomyrmex costatus]|uniref:YqaJ viral recombinase domain-containing protein n=1 Tax=Cyphomyrmex costatus TaxID=456900 RepID=A0A151IN42_9HYME|nr:hypothetical protein ALC62_02801 [Cyphomyrmex costatus]